MSHTPRSAVPAKQLLLVDDQPEVALIVQRFCKRAGQEVMSCPDVPSAWDWLSGHQPDLIILDLNLPGENGLTLCRRIRATPRLVKLHVALFSDWDRPEDIVAGLASGVDSALTKDLLGQPNQWRDRIEELLSPEDSRSYRQFLSWTGRPLPLELMKKWLDALNRGLHKQVLRIGKEVVEILVRRAVNRSGMGPVVQGLLLNGCSFDVERLLRLLRPVDLVHLTAALAEQLWCVVGTTASVPFRTDLLIAIPSLADCFPE